jgi:hypothetical protein
VNPSSRARRAGLLLCVALLAGASLAHATPAQTDPAVRAFRAQRFDELEKRLTALYARREGDRYEAGLFDEALERIARAIELDPALDPIPDRWQKGAPKSARPLLVKARLALLRAWQVRGGGLANTVPDEAGRSSVAASRSPTDCWRPDGGSIRRTYPPRCCASRRRC